MRRSDLSVGLEVLAVTSSSRNWRTVRPALVLSTETGWVPKPGWDHAIEKGTLVDRDYVERKSPMVAIAYHDLDDCWYPKAIQTSSLHRMNQGAKDRFDSQLVRRKNQDARDSRNNTVEEALRSLLADADADCWAEDPADWKVTVSLRELVGYLWNFVEEPPEAINRLVELVGMP